MIPCPRPRVGLPACLRACVPSVSVAVTGFQPSVMVGTAGAAEVAQSQFRALDVFIVQANTNTLLSHFCSLAASLWLLERTPKLAKLAKGKY